MGQRRNFLMRAGQFGHSLELCEDVAEMERSKYPYCVKGGVGDANYILELSVLGNRKMIDASLKCGDVKEEYIWSPK